MAKDGKMEKWILRKAFEDYLSGSIAWRQKEQFSDGVGYSWIDTLRGLTSSQVSDEQLVNAKYRFAVNPPLSKEEYFCRAVFAGHCPSDTEAQCVPSVACSIPEALAWDASFRNMNDPSGCAVITVHKEGHV
jgi:asparagine synthase (glutamine-hydrolysing)